MGAAHIQSPARGDFIENHNSTQIACELSYGLNKLSLRLMISYRLKDYNPYAILMFIDQPQKPLGVIICKRIRRTLQCLRNASRIQSWQKMSVYCFIIGKVSRQIPIMPTVVATEQNGVLSGFSPSYPYGYGHRFSPCPCVSDHISPGMKIA